MGVSNIYSLLAYELLIDGRSTSYVDHEVLLH